MNTRRITRSQTLSSKLKSTTTSIATKTSILKDRNVNKIKKLNSSKIKDTEQAKDAENSILPYQDNVSDKIDVLTDESHPIIAAIIKKDPNFKTLLKFPKTPCSLLSKPDLNKGNDFTFEALARAIIYQQVSYKAAFTIYNRVIALYNEDGSFPTPKQILNSDFEYLRSVGLTISKTNYLIDLSKKYHEGILSDEILLKLSDEEISKKLCQIKGIGQWTVDIFLIGILHRLDVLPVGDLVIKKKVIKYFNITPKGKSLISSKDMVTACEVWRPYRSIASWYLWQWKRAEG